MIEKMPEGRSKGTLLAVIRTHIQTGEPVGSSTVARQQREQLSSASIRNIMMELEREGYLEQPHISAGRIPTEKAYRYYVSQCNADHPPSKTDQLLIHSYLEKTSELTDEALSEKTSHVLSLISQNLGVVVLEPLAQAVLENIHFVLLGDKKILVVLVSERSQIKHHVIRIDNEMSERELEAASNYLNQHFRGWELDKIRAELMRQLHEDRASYDHVLKDLRELYDQGMLEDSSPADVFLDGAANLAGKPELANPAQIQELLRALEEKEKVVSLLGECIRVPGDPLQVVVGLPGRPSVLKGFALVGASFSWRGRVRGRFAILGPSRMEYNRVIRAVRHVGRILQEDNLQNTLH
ncbi:MAG: heat-inducible transcription repressor HrcA [Acidobacteria bacterium RIFCSPLOWO2_12_FULL_54_10]|nr:MAG: heat-inducible transcription repressor HrcA [Acidobacteria bacterium RIFCSPLOWO2_12_FULL_54_10]